MLISGLREKYPQTRFIGEESVAAGDKCTLTDEQTWIIDPIDGTTNFVSSNPQICTILAFMVEKVHNSRTGTNDTNSTSRKFNLELFTIQFWTNYGQLRRDMEQNTTGKRLSIPPIDL